MARPDPIGGFPEWLPEQRAVELRFMDHIRRTFELHGFCSIETAAVERLETILAKGETDKEIYTLRRLHAEPDGGDADDLALHFDLTVPLARYVAQNFGKLTFPFKRYQIQKVWRGERPQEGRYREFYQCDIDVVANGELPLVFDAELPAVMHEVFAGLGVPPLTVQLSNRKVLSGFYAGLGIEDPTLTLRIVDKLAKIGPDGVRAQLVEHAGLPAEVAGRCLALGQIQSEGMEFADAVRGLGVTHPLLERGLDELCYVREQLGRMSDGAVVVDLSISRGFDYYTGTVYEAILAGHEDLGSVCSGGRYDDLVSGFSKQTLPGVGLSIGLSRLLGRLLARGDVAPGVRSPAVVLVALPSEAVRASAIATARALRSRQIATEVYHAEHRYGKQIQYAGRKGIRYVWFPGQDGGAHEVRDLAVGAQVEADPTQWTPG